MWQSQTVIMAQGAPSQLTPTDWITAAATAAVAMVAIVEITQLSSHKRRRRAAADLSIRSSATVLRSDPRIAHRMPLRRDADGFMELAQQTLDGLIALVPQFTILAQHFTDASGPIAARAGEAYSLFNRSTSYLQRVVTSFPANNADEAFTVTTEQNLKRCVGILFEIGDAPEWDIPHSDESKSAFLRWRRLHRGSSWLLAILALVHSALTFRLGVGWAPEAVWFLGTGLGLLLLALMNLAHVGLGPCPQPTAVAVRYVNWFFVAFGVAAVVAVPEPQAYVVLAALLGQALAGTHTLTGPA